MIGGAHGGRTRSRCVQRGSDSGRELRWQREGLAVETRKSVTVIDHDEHIRTDASFESMAKLRPVFKENGTVSSDIAAIFERL